MAREWNEAQKAAICRAGGPLLVSAAAGSGKTTVLVERAVRLVTREENPVPADRLLILTFTNAAAAELRARIAARIEEAVREAGHAPALLRQKLRVKRAFIGTMDAFCQQLVREHFTAADIPPDVEVADEAGLEQLRRAALDETMEEMYADEAFERFAALYGRARSDSELENAVLALYEFTRSLPEPDSVLEAFLQMARDRAPVGETPWGRALLRFAAESAEAAVALAQEALDTAGSEPELAAYLPALQGDLDAFARVRAAVAADDWDGAVAAATAYVPLRLGSAKAKYESAGKEFAKKSHAELKKMMAELLKGCLACTEAEYEADNAEAGPYTEALIRAVRLFSEKYLRAKLDERVLDFSDFLHIAYGLLVQNGTCTELAARVCVRYDVVMVDEYQDTNDLQDALYAALAGDGAQKLFCVGDVKQSIYRFRSANSGIFLEKKERWACAGESRVITLGHNYRSGAGVIDGVNHIFDRLMSRALGEVEYGATERLLRGREAEGEAAGVELCVVNDPDRRGDAGYVAGRIEQMVRDGYLVQGADGPRPCEYGDFCVMLRTNGHMASYAAALAARGIPVASAAGGDFLSAPEVLPVVAALRAVSNPGDDVALCAFLMGPLVRFTPDDMLALRLGQPKGGLFSAVLNSGSEKAAAFLETLRLYRALACEMPPGRLCEELVERSGYLSAVAAMRGGAARRENLLSFIRWTNASSSALRGGLAGFVRLLESAAAPGGAGYKGVKGHVSLLSIHKSKGLEFPVCFLARAQHEFNKRELRDHVLMHQSLSVGIDLRAGEVLYPTLQSLAVRRMREREGLSEEMRVLYVALTRAKEKMIVTMPSQDPEKTLADALEGAERPGAYALSKKQSFAAWLLAAAPVLCADGTPLCAFTVRVAEMEKPPEAGGGAYALTSAPDGALVAALAAGFARKPQREQLRAVPTKISVSQLAKQGAAQPVRKRPSFMYKSGLTAAERGTAMHLFMQMADYTAARVNPEAEVKRLADGAFITPEAAGALDLGGIRRFFASGLAARIAAADTVLREYDFITGVPAGEIDPALTGESANELVMVQGIADAVLVFADHVELVDYKTDHGKTAGELAAMYRRQLALYKRALEKRLGQPVTRLTLWSFDLGYEVDVG